MIKKGKTTETISISVPTYIAELLRQESNASKTVTTILVQNVHLLENGDVGKQESIATNHAVKNILERLKPKLKELIEEILEEIGDA